MEPKFTLECLGERLEVYETHVTFVPTGSFSRLIGREHRILPFSTIQSVSFREPSLFVGGAIRFAVTGGTQTSSLWAEFDANTFMYNPRDKNLAEEAYRYVLERCARS